MRRQVSASLGAGRVGPGLVGPLLGEEGLLLPASLSASSRPPSLPYFLPLCFLPLLPFSHFLHPSHPIFTQGLTLNLKKLHKDEYLPCYQGYKCLSRVPDPVFFN